jgi:diguanylate cyclase (GGDEF)-like protein
MKLQTKVVLILSGAWIVISLLIYYDSKIMLSENYEKVEKTLILNDVRDVRKAFDRMLFTLSLYSLAWAQWDEAYDFMLKLNKKFIKSNFVPGTYTSSKINFFMFYDRAGKFYYGQAYDLIHDKVMPAPAGLLDYLAKHPKFVTHSSTTSTKAGILNTPEGLVVMSSLPVITGNGQGPVRGTLLMGYYLNNTHIKNLSEIVDMKLDFFSLPLTSSANEMLTSAYSHLKAGAGNYVVPINNKIAYGFILLKDIDGQPVGLLKMQVHRLVYEEGVITVRHYFMIFIALGIIIGTLIWYLLKIFILNRVLSVSNQVVDFNKKNEFKKRIEISGKDELGDMIYYINRMMELITISQNQLHYLAHHDILTSLPNRSMFFDKLDKAILEAKKTGERLAVMFLDLDKFKSVNDIYGHNMGDKLLKAVANRLQHTIKDTDIVARQSGDEFIVFIKKIIRKSDVDATAQRILEEMSQPFHVNNIQIKMLLSIGISIFPDDGNNVEDLIRLSDNAMYVAKKQGGNIFRYHHGSAETVNE